MEGVYFFERRCILILRTFCAIALLLFGNGMTEIIESYFFLDDGFNWILLRRTRSIRRVCDRDHVRWRSDLEGFRYGSARGKSCPLP